MATVARAATKLSRIPLRAGARGAHSTSVMSPVEPHSLPAVSDQGIGKRLYVWKGDITKLKTHVIVNAANKSLLGGGGVDGAIHRAAGPDLLRECRTLGGANTGEVKVTKGYDLPAKYVAHAVGPIYSSSRADQCASQLASCYRSALEHCTKLGGNHIAFPSISTGIYGYPIEDATEIAIQTTTEFLEKDDTVTHVVFCVFSHEDEQVYKKLIPAIVPASKQ